jgi:hypothetical protein
MAKHSKPAEAAPKAQKAPPSDPAATVEASAQVAEPAAPMAAQTQLLHVRLLSDTPAGRDLPFGLNGQWINVKPSQYMANSDILARA